MHGNGHLVWANGRQYQGQFKNDLKEGTGIYRWSDGQEYFGQWLNGK